MWILVLLLSLFSPIRSFAQDVVPLASPEASPTAVITAPTDTPFPTPSADALFKQYQNDYLYQVKLYQDAYRIYTEKKQVNLKYGTVTTQKEILDASKNALIARNNLLKSYLLALRVKLEKYSSSNPNETDKSKIEISSWEKWLNEQNLILNTINNLDDVKSQSNSFKSHHNEILKTIYSALVRDQINYQANILNRLQVLGDQLKASPQIPQDQIQWFSPIIISADLINQSFTQALESTKQYQVGNDFNNFYPEATKQLSKADGYLLDISKTLKSIIIKFLTTND
jgi:hypothetical protein